MNVSTGARTKTLKLLLVGVGGQGVLTVARIVGDAALRAGLEVTVGALHGMAQRGGSVEATLLVGDRVRSSFIEQADVVLGFEPMEALRALPRITERTRVVVNLAPVVPFPLSMQGLPYPAVEGMLDTIRSVTPHLTPVDGSALLAELSDLRGLNLLLLGVLTGLELLPCDAALLREAAERRSSPRRREANLRAFDRGCELGASLKGPAADQRE